MFSGSTLRLIKIHRSICCARLTKSLNLMPSSLMGCLAVWYFVWASFFCIRRLFMPLLVLLGSTGWLRPRQGSGHGGTEGARVHDSGLILQATSATSHKRQRHLWTAKSSYEAYCWRASHPFNTEIEEQNERWIHLPTSPSPERAGSSNCGEKRLRNKNKKNKKNEFKTKQ